MRKIWFCQDTRWMFEVHGIYKPVEEICLKIDKGGEEGIMNDVWMKHGTVAGESLGKSPLADYTLRKLQIWDACIVVDTCQ